jgi:hypothetical protein
MKRCLGSTPRAWRPSAAQDREASARHEAGHFAVAAHFGLETCTTVWRMGPSTLWRRAWVGQTRFSPTPSPFRLAVIGWGGLLAEARFLTPEDVTGENLWAWFNATLELVELDASYSDSDAKSVSGHPSWHACRTADRILTRETRLLDEVARALARGGTRCFASYPPCVQLAGAA